MKNTATLSFDFEGDAQTYASLLKEEDFDFKNKQISIDVNQNGSKIEVTLESDSILEFKIGVTALTKSLEVINKTLTI